MSFPVLDAKTRSNFGKGASKKLRREGLVPAIIYAKGKETAHFELNAKEIMQKLNPENGINTMFSLKFSEGERSVLIKKIDKHHMDGSLIHIDFIEVLPDEDYGVRVPLRFTGRSKGVMMGGKLSFFRKDITIQGKAGSLPKFIDFDITETISGDKVFIKDITLPEGFTCLNQENYKVLEVGAAGQYDEEETEEEESNE